MALCRYTLAFSPLVDMERQEVIDWIDEVAGDHWDQ